jgi:hypothetical protein
MKLVTELLIWLGAANSPFTSLAQSNVVQSGPLHIDSSGIGIIIEWKYVLSALGALLLAIWWGLKWVWKMWVASNDKHDLEIASLRQHVDSEIAVCKEQKKKLDSKIAAWARLLRSKISVKKLSVNFVSEIQNNGELRSDLARIMASDLLLANPALFEQNVVDFLRRRGLTIPDEEPAMKLLAEVFKQVEMKLQKQTQHKNKQGI